MIHIGEATSSARHHACCRIKELLKRQVVESRGASLAERGDEIARETGTMDIHTHTYHGGGVKHRIDAGL